MYRYVKRFDDRKLRGNLMSIPLHLYFDDECNPDIPPGARYDEIADEYFLDVPWKYVICDHCNGHGTHVNPSIDGNGITSEEWDRDWDDDAREDYFAGVYDVSCEARCHEGKIMVPNTDNMTEEMQKIIKKWEHEESERDYENRCDARTRWYEDGCPRD